MQTLIDLTINYWVQALFGVMAIGIGTLFRWLIGRFKDNDRRQDAMEKGIQALLRDRIVQAYYHYAERGWITLHGLEAIDKMYTEYHNLGGNGTVTKLWLDLHKLEVRDD
ncbi:MAG: hypothetical protein AB7C89_08790 [Intestinibacillus sp.]